MTDRIRVDVEYIYALKEALAVINRQNFDDIAWYEKGKPIKFKPEKAKQFQFCGLNNVDFVHWLDLKGVRTRK